jgi:endonuclease/exonuclease/phosphatase family metal-dependent hydrolase
VNWSSHRRHLASALAIVSCLQTDPLLASDSGRDDGMISVLSYNIRGLFPFGATDRPGKRVPTIGWLANKYDVVLFQEDLEYQGDLAAQMLGKVGFRGNGVGSDPRRLVPKVLLTPLALLIPHFWPPYGSGLSSFADDRLIADRDDVDRVAYGICSGWFDAPADCWAAKGFLRIGLRMPNGAEVDVYTTHLDAGPDQASVSARWKQLNLLATAIERRNGARGVIVAGDLNIAYNRSGDGWVLDDFRRRLGLLDSGAGAELAHWRERDYLLYRDGTRAKISVERAGEAREFVNRDRALSDHPAIYAHLRIVPPRSGQETSAQREAAP